MKLVGMELMFSYFRQSELRKPFGSISVSRLTHTLLVVSKIQGGKVRRAKYLCAKYGNITLLYFVRRTLHACILPTTGNKVPTCKEHVGNVRSNQK